MKEINIITGGGTTTQTVKGQVCEQCSGGGGLLAALRLSAAPTIPPGTPTRPGLQSVQSTLAMGQVPEDYHGDRGLLLLLPSKKSQRARQASKGQPVEENGYPIHPSMGSKG